jgi:hypothetical protein
VAEAVDEAPRSAFELLLAKEDELLAGAGDLDRGELIAAAAELNRKLELDVAVVGLGVGLHGRNPLMASCRSSPGASAGGCW